METKKSSIENITLERVPMSERKSWWSIAFIWAGNVICVPALMVGGMVAAGQSFGMAALAMLLGFGLVVVYMTFLGGMSSDLGVPSTVAISRAFGSRGSGFAVGIVIAISSIGWFAFQTYVCGSSFSMIMQMYLGIDVPLWLSCIIWGCAMFITSVYGITWIKILNYVSVPALLILLVYGAIYTLSQPGAAEMLANYVPPTPQPFLVGLTYAVSGFAVGAVISGDYLRYCKTRTDTALASFFGVIPAGVGALVLGSLLAISAGNYDITVMFANIGLPIIGLIVLILATWTTNTGNAYSAGIALVNVFKLKDNKRSTVTLICGALGTLLAIIGVINYFTTFLGFISNMLPPIAGVAIADYWIKGRANPKAWKPWPGVNWLGMISWACGTAFGILFPGVFVPTINAIVVSMVVYLVLVSVVKSDKLNPFAKPLIEQNIHLD